MGLNKDFEKWFKKKVAKGKVKGVKIASVEEMNKIFKDIRGETKR